MATNKAAEAKIRAKSAEAQAKKEREEKRRQAAIVRIAEHCHAINKLYCELTGDRSQVPWALTTPNIKASAIDGVEAVAKGLVKEPGDSHRNWLEFKAKDGWEFGEIKDEENKLHPCMVPFEELPETQRVKDELFLITATQGLKFYNLLD